MQSWDVEQAIVRQRVQEEHIVWLLRLLHNFIDPGDVMTEALTQSAAAASSSPASATNHTPAAAASNSSTAAVTNSPAADASNNSAAVITCRTSHPAAHAVVAPAVNSTAITRTTKPCSMQELSASGGVTVESTVDRVMSTVTSTTTSITVDGTSSRASTTANLTDTLMSHSSPSKAGSSISALTSAESERSSEHLMEQLLTLIHNTQFMDKIASHLSNDSVLDLSRHVPLYRALLSIVRSIAVTEPLCPLLLHKPTFVNSCGEQQVCSGNASLLQLLSRMTKTVNTYISKLAWKPSSKSAGAAPTSSSSKATSQTSGASTSAASSNGPYVKNLVKTLMYMDDVYESGKTKLDDQGLAADDTDDEGLTMLVPDLQRTEQLVKRAFERLSADRMAAEDGDQSSEDTSTDDTVSKSLTDIYLDALKPLQFDSFEMVVEEAASGNVRFTVSHLFEGSLRNISSCVAPRRIKRLAQEAVTLSTSLPLSYSSSVFIRTDTDRLDIMKVLIIGPEDTPYANGLFEFDVYFPVDYPTSPLQIKLQTTGEGRVRFNPNLYQDGKVCLSILNTWHGRPEEKWNSQTSSLLQVLVSIQSLILVSEPYFNEPGYERSRGTATATQHSREYDANIRASTAKWAILHQLKEPSPCFKEISERHFYLKQHEILAQIEAWIVEMEGFPEYSRRANRGLPHHISSLKKLLVQLKEEFTKLKAPAGLEAVHLPPPPPPPPATEAPATSTSAGSFPKPRERKTSKANLMSDLKWSVIDEEAEDEQSQDLGGGKNSASSSADTAAPSLQATTLNGLAAAMSSTANLFSASYLSSLTSPPAHTTPSSSSTSGADPFNHIGGLHAATTTTTSGLTMEQQQEFELDMTGSYSLSTLPNFVNLEPDESL